MTERKINSLVFSGGGTRCLSFLFALKHLIDSKIIYEDDKIKNIYGTSAGSFIAALLSIGKISQIDKVIEIAKKTNFKKALNIDLVHILNFPKVFGLDDKSSIKSMVCEVLEMFDKTSSGLKFKDLETLNIVVADLTDAKTVVLNHKTTPEMFIVDGIIASMSLPFLYIPSYGLDGHMYVDGGLRANFPWDCLENDEERTNAIGFTFQTSQSGIIGENPMNLQSFIYRMIHFDNLHVSLKNKSTWNKNIVFINIPNFPTHYMNIKPEDLAELEHVGILGADDYIERNKITNHSCIDDKVISHITQPSISGIVESPLDHEKIPHPFPKSASHQDHTDGMLDIPQYSWLCKSLSLQQHSHISRSGPSGRRWSV
jgi:predicted acylesterase/phospholipase RssA